MTGVGFDVHGVGFDLTKSQSQRNRMSKDDAPPEDKRYISHICSMEEPSDEYEPRGSMASKNAIINDILDIRISDSPRLSFELPPAEDSSPVRKTISREAAHSHLRTFHDIDHLATEVVVTEEEEANLTDRELMRKILKVVQDESRSAEMRQEELFIGLQQQQEDLKLQLHEMGFRGRPNGASRDSNGSSWEANGSRSVDVKEMASLNRLSKVPRKSFRASVMSNFTQVAKPEGLTQQSKLQFSGSRSYSGALPGSGKKLWWIYAIAELVRDERFEMLITAAIMVCSVVLCFEAQYEGLQIGYDLQYRGCRDSASNVWPLASGVFKVSDWFFGILFLVEVLLKTTSFGCKFFYDIWNWLDICCAMAFIIDKIAAAVLPLGSQVLRLLRLIRLFRLVRLLRTLEALDHLYIMTTAVRGTTMVLTWAVVLLSLMLMTISLFLTQMLYSTYFEGVSVENLSMEELAIHNKLYEHFGSFTRCFLSMFEITLANWPPVTRLLAEEVSEWFMLLCLVHKMTIGFAVVGVINGVILQETFKVAATDDIIMVRQHKQQSETLTKKMMALLQALDHSNDGMLDLAEFEIIARQPDVKAWLASMDIETDDLPTLFMLLDVDGDGQVTAEELARRIPRLKGAARSMDVLALCKRLKTVHLVEKSPHSKRAAANSATLDLPPPTQNSGFH